MSDDVKTIAVKFFEYCRSGKEEACLNELYADDAVSVEAAPMPGADSAEASGLDAIRAKHAWWNTAMDVHSSSAEGPFYHGTDRFGAIFEIDVTNKETNERTQMKELGVYTVADGKIVREEFFYDA